MSKQRPITTFFCRRGDDQAQESHVRQDEELEVSQVPRPVPEQVASRNAGDERDTSRSYQPHWSEKFKWIKYDSQLDKVFCSTCQMASESKLLLPTGSQSDKAITAYVKEGFSNWKKALEKFNLHEISAFHKAATQGILSLSNPNSSVGSSFNSGAKQHLIDARTALSAIFSSLKFLGMQDLAIRGKEEETSNFRQLLKLRANDIPVGGFLNLNIFVILNSSVILIILFSIRC